MTPDDARLQSAYRRLTADESRSAEAPDVSPETLQQLAEGTYLGADRDELLERALAHDSTARELAFFMDLRAANAQRVAAAPWRGWALAATVLIVVISGIRWFGTSASEEPLRSSESTVTVVQPREGAAVEGSTIFMWRAVAGASRYLVEVIREDGTLTASTTTADTSATLALTPLTPRERLSWWVTATLSDGTTRRSAAASLRAR
jgi:hypothetical protein